MAREHPAIPVLDLSGTPRQIGAAHGEDQRTRIQECVDRFLSWIYSGAAVTVDQQSLWAKWSPQVSFNEQVAPQLMAEMREIARGANVPFERLFLLNSMLDVLSFRYLPMAQNFGCGTFAGEAGILLVATLFSLVFGGRTQHAGLLHPAAEIAGNLADEPLILFFQRIQKLAVTAIQCVKRPGPDQDAVEQHATDQIHGDLRLGLERHVVRHVVFLRRTGSLA